MARPLFPPILRDAVGRRVESMLLRVFQEPVHRVFVYLLDSVIEGALPHLAWGFGVLDDPLWELADTAAERRAFLKEALYLKRKKGTPWSIRRALEIAGWTATVQHRFPPLRWDGEATFDGTFTWGDGLRWAHFDVTVYLSGAAYPSAEDQDAIRRVIRHYKPASRRLRNLLFVAAGPFAEDWDSIWDPGAAPAAAGAAFAEGFESSIFEEPFDAIWDPGAAPASSGSAFSEGFE